MFPFIFKIYVKKIGMDKRMLQERIWYRKSVETNTHKKSTLLLIMGKERGIGDVLSKYKEFWEYS